MIIPEGTALEPSGVAVVGTTQMMVTPVPAGTSGLVVRIHSHTVPGDVQVLHGNRRANRTSSKWGQSPQHGATRSGLAVR